MTSRGLFALLVGLVVMTGAHRATTQTRVRERNPTWVAPTEEDARPNPLASRPQLVAGGRKLFTQRCSDCHGSDARGTDRAPDLTAPDVQAQTDGALFWKISSGDTRGGMPSFSGLPSPQRWQLVLFLRAR